VQRHAVRHLLPVERQRAVARHADGVRGIERRRVAAHLREEARLRFERIGAAEGGWVDELEEEVAARRLFRVAAADAGEARGQRLDQDGEGEALVALFEAAGRHDRARRVGEEGGGVVARLAGVAPPVVAIVDHHRLRQPAAHALRALEVAVGRARRAGVDQDRRAVRRDAEGDRIGGIARRPPAEGRDRAVAGRRGGEDRHRATLRRALHVGREAGDVLRMAHRDGDGRVLLQPVQRHVQRPHDDPLPRQHLPVQQQRAAVVGEHGRLARPGRAPGLDPRNVGGHELQPVRGDAEQVRLDQDFRHHRRDRPVEPGGGEQVRGTGDEVGVAVAVGHGGLRGGGWSGKGSRERQRAHPSTGAG